MFFAYRIFQHIQERLSCSLLSSVLQEKTMSTYLQLLTISPSLLPKEPGMEATPVPAHRAPKGTMKKRGNPARHNHHTAPAPPTGW